MKDCRNIRGELSAYLDGELTPPQRTEVETHLASCAHCQRELVELKTLVTGVAALPKLQPTPRFLAEVRRKIASDGKPGALTWQDYVFRPLWLKIPLEVAALIVIAGLVIRSGHPLSAKKAASLEFAKAENSEAKQATANEPKSAVAAQMPTAAGPRRTPVIGNADEVSATPPSAPSPVIDLVRSVEFPRAKPGEIMTVHARVFDDVRNRAQQLATRCNGRVVVVPQSKDATDRTLFVEMPREYVAAFKLELSRITGSSAALATGGSAGESDTTSAVMSSAGVLTGNAPTNNSVDGLATFGLGNDATIVAPTTLLEIRVVAPAN